MIQKLFVYGTLGPGQPNEHLLKELGGTWAKGYVLGKLFKEGWGAYWGYPGVRLEHKGEKIKGYVFTSDQLKNHWDMLDDFEGEAYKRVKTVVYLENDNSEIEAFIYAIR